MKNYIKTSNYYLWVLTTVINSTSETGTFEVDSVESAWVTLPESWFYWLDVDFETQSEREIFRITGRVGNTLTYDKRISPNGKFKHEEWAVVWLRDFAELFNSLSSNTDNFWQVEQLTNTQVKIYWWHVFTEWYWTREISTQTLTITPNNLKQYLYFDTTADAWHEFTIKADLTPELYLLAEIDTDTSSITWITDVRWSLIWVDFSEFQTKWNMVEDLDSPNNNDYPTTKAVMDAIEAHWWWGWWTSLLWGWDAETWLPTNLQTWYNYKNWDEFLVDNIKTISYRKERYWNFHVPTSEDLQTLSSIINTLLPSSDYSWSYYTFDTSTEFIVDVKNILKCPTSSLNIFWVDLFAQAFSGSQSAIILPLFLFRWNKTFQFDIGWYQLNISDFLVISSQSGQGNVTSCFSESLQSAGVIGEMSLFLWDASAYPVRLFADEAVIPDGSWTVLKSWTWWWGSYWNQSLWLISLSADWTEWITIQDKNVWATELAPVFTDEIDLVDSNWIWSWNYFQLWNCNWFDRYWPFNKQEWQYTWNVLPLISPFYCWTLADGWCANKNILTNMQWAIDSSGWRFIINTLENFGITDYHDISRVLMLPLAWYLAGQDGVWQRDRSNIWWYYRCWDWDDTNKECTHVLINIPNDPNNDPIWLSKGGLRLEWYNIRSYSLSIEDDTGWSAVTDAQTLFDWSSYATWAWIFYSPYNKTIRIYDWTTSLYISDRNGWAIKPYHYWDQIDLSNVWAFYQFWKSLWYFPTLAFDVIGIDTYDIPVRDDYQCSSQKVETSWYKPYQYSEDTFIAPIVLSNEAWQEALLILSSWQMTINNRLREFSNEEYYWLNYKPSWIRYNWTPSSVVETTEISEWSKYTFLDWEWLLDKVSIYFKDIQWSPLDNEALAEELNKYAEKNDVVKYSDYALNNTEVGGSSYSIQSLSSEITVADRYLNLRCDSAKSWMTYTVLIHWEWSWYHYITLVSGIEDPMWRLPSSFSPGTTILTFIATSNSKLIYTWQMNW